MTTPSSDYDNNFTSSANVSNIIAKSLTDGIATFSGGTIVNLVSPPTIQSAVTKSFVDGLVNVAPPTNSVQINNLIFTGSPNLTFVPNTLTVNGTINTSLVSITGGVISNLNDPVSSNQIATKNYVDSTSNSTVNNYIKSDTGITYTTAQMINGFILRNLTTYNVFGVSLTDTTPTAAQFIAAVPYASVGYTARFGIMNDNPDGNGGTIESRDSFTLVINPASGVTFYPGNNFILRRGYILEAFIQFNNITTPAVTIVITNCGYSGGPNLYLQPVPFSSESVLRNTVDYLNHTSASLTGNLFWNLNNTTDTSTSYSYTTADVKNQFITRNPTGTASDTFGSSINPVYLNQIMTIQNPSTYTITVSGQTNIWTLIPNPITIPASTQAILSVTINNPTLSSIGSYYSYGSYNTTGGTGSGFTLSINNLYTSFNLTAGGLSYALGDYSTTNLTTPGSTGLVVNVSGINTSGTITGILTITNYLNGGYRNNDVIQINGGDGNARIQLVSVNSVPSVYAITVTSLGNGAYVASDVLNIFGPGTGTGAQITLGSFIVVRTIGKFSL